MLSGGKMDTAGTAPLGAVSMMTKTEAQVQLAAIVTPINIKQASGSRKVTVEEFVNLIYLPFYRRKWKSSTAQANEERISYHLLPEFKNRTLGSLDRDELQGFLERKAAEGFSFSVVDHLRWDLKQIFDLAVSEAMRSTKPGVATVYSQRGSQTNPAGDESGGGENGSFGA